MIFYTINEKNIQAKKIEAAGVPIDWMATAMKKMSKDFPTFDDIDNIIMVFVDAPVKIENSTDTAKQYKIMKDLHMVALPINEQISLNYEGKTFEFVGNKVNFKSVEALKQREDGLPEKMTAQEMLAINWLKEGKVGTSAKTMCFNLFPNLKTYYDINNPGKDFGEDTPHDCSDFNRCMLFANEVNLYPDQLEKVATINSKWAKIIDNWEQLTELITSGDKESRDTAYDLIKECIGSPVRSRKP